jgi:Asp-tRNA(Asn)/Glu-tRNA(Gln) amidotransferase A subunit family amidase
MRGVSARLLSERMVSDLEGECETLLDVVRQEFMMVRAGTIKRGLIGFVQKYIKHNERTCKMLNTFKRMNPSEFSLFLGKMEKFVHDFSMKWQNLGFTALVSPVMPHSAFSRETVMNPSAHQMGEYNFLWSITGFPAGVLPVTRV